MHLVSGLGVVGFHTHHTAQEARIFPTLSSRLHMAEDESTESYNDRIDNTMKRGRRRKANRVERDRMMRDVDSPISNNNSRARMKKVSSKLLRPPTGLSSRQVSSDSGQWANNLSQNKRERKRTTDRKRIVNRIDNPGEKRRKGGKSYNRDLSFPPFTSSSKGSPVDYQLDLYQQDFSGFSSSTIEGVLPVSELFYRSSTQSLFSSDNFSAEGTMNKQTDSQQGERDDEELPFSAEQSDQLSTPGNKILIRRNKAYTSPLLLGDVAPSEAVRRELATMAEQEMEEQRQLKLWKEKNQQRVGSIGNQTSIQTNMTNDASNVGSKGGSVGKSESKTQHKKANSRQSKGRKMVRRGMEMLVGGEPINADPPQRSIELNYFRKHPNLWARGITTNSPDFGPLLHMHSAGKVGEKSIGLFCEHFVDAAQKWGICPDDLTNLLDQHDAEMPSPSVSEDDMDALIETVSTIEVRNNYTDSKERSDSDGQIIFNSHPLDKPKGFGTKRKRTTSFGNKLSEPVTTVSGHSSIENNPLQTDVTFNLGGELKFTLRVDRSDFEDDHGRAFRRVLRNGIGMSINADELDFDVHIAKLSIVDNKEGTLDIGVKFELLPRKVMGMVKAKRAAKEVNGALASAMDDGKMATELARAAREETGWSTKVRDRIIEEFLFEETEEDDDSKDYKKTDAEVNGKEDNFLQKIDNYDGPFGMEGDVIYEQDDLWLGGGNGGVFTDYSESNHLNSPYKGNLGPMLVDAAAERARQNQPRVIAIGDVHGCIDELKALLKKCNYHPGDLVVFLGDLVCKGPDSLSVVQMAREIGAIGVRGNHDFEVVRWHQAIMSGADPPVIGSEHYYVASALSTADLKWMYSLPWFITSSHLNALFVHAGFVSGIRLAKQNPRLMMNMRSILPDGTVTSKFFNNWPWARLWDGPQTVFFGHDADRGLQQYEHAIGLDTGCVYGGKLTACILPERRLVSVNSKREYFQYRRKHFD